MDASEFNKLIISSNDYSKDISESNININNCTGISLNIKTKNNKTNIIGLTIDNCKFDPNTNYYKNINNYTINLDDSILAHNIKISNIFFSGIRSVILYYENTIIIYCNNLQEVTENLDNFAYGAIINGLGNETELPILIINYNNYYKYFNNYYKINQDNININNIIKSINNIFDFLKTNTFYKNQKDDKTCELLHSNLKYIIGYYKYIIFFNCNITNYVSIDLTKNDVESTIIFEDCMFEEREPDKCCIILDHANVLKFERFVFKSETNINYNNNNELIFTINTSQLYFEIAGKGNNISLTNNKPIKTITIIQKFKDNDDNIKDNKINFYINCIDSNKTFDENQDEILEEAKTKLSNVNEFIEICNKYIADDNDDGSNVENFIRNVVNNLIDEKGLYNLNYDEVTNNKFASIYIDLFKYFTNQKKSSSLNNQLSSSSSSRSSSFSRSPSPTQIRKLSPSSDSDFDYFFLQEQEEELKKKFKTKGGMDSYQNRKSSFLNLFQKL